MYVGICIYVCMDVNVFVCVSICDHVHVSAHASRARGSTGSPESRVVCGCKPPKVGTRKPVWFLCEGSKHYSAISPASCHGLHYAFLYILS